MGVGASLGMMPFRGFFGRFVDPLNMVDVLDVGLNKFRPGRNVVPAEILPGRHGLELFAQAFLNGVCEEFGDRFHRTGFKRIVRSASALPPYDVNRVPS